MPLRALASSRLPHSVTPIGPAEARRILATCHEPGKAMPLTPAEASRYGLSPEQARWLNRRRFDTPTVPAATLHTQLLATIAAGKL